jgi:Sap, sulfolipid-1-addressing protein
MLAQIAGFAVLAALSPAALLASAVFLGAANPRVTTLVYLAGAIVMTAVVAAIVYAALRAGHLNRPHHHQPIYGLRLGLGLATLGLGLFLRRYYARHPRDPAKPDKGLMTRLMSSPSPKSAFLVGVLVYSPSLTFIAAVQVVATSRDSTADSVLLLALIIAITVVLVWLPLLVHVFIPGHTSRLLTGFNAWLRAHGRLLLVVVLIGGGAVLAVNGVLGLAGVVS